MKYKRLDIMDEEEEPMINYFEECIDFISSAISDGGKVLVHCSAGVSRRRVFYAGYKYELLMFEHLLILVVPV